MTSNRFGTLAALPLNAAEGAVFALKPAAADEATLKKARIERQLAE